MDQLPPAYAKHQVVEGAEMDRTEAELARKRRPRSPLLGRIVLSNTRKDVRAPHDYKSSFRWRRSRLPFTSSHASKELTLALARAIEQSAAP
jgi:hypothetical protein